MFLEYGVFYLKMENEDKIKKKELRLGVLRGILAENYAKYKMQEEGYEMTKLTGRTKEGQFFRDFYVVKLIKGYEKDINGFIKFLRDNLYGLPDYIFVKDNKIGFIEVKSNNAKLKQTQFKTFQILKEKGYEIIIMNFKVELGIKEEPYTRYDEYE